MPVASVLGCVKSGSPETVLQLSGLPLYCEGCCGGVLLSHTLPGAVPSALAGLASRFGMDAGRFPAAMTTTSGSTSIHFVPRCCFGGCVGCDPHSGDEHPWMSVNHTVYTFVVDKCLLVSAH